MSKRTFSKDGVTVEMASYHTLRAVIIDEELRDAIPESSGWTGRRKILFGNFVIFVSYLTNVTVENENDETAELAAWWAKHRNFDDLRLMWEDWIKLPTDVSNILFLEAYNATRRNVLPPSEEFKPGAKKKAQSDEDFLEEDVPLPAAS